MKKQMYEIMLVGSIVIFLIVIFFGALSLQGADVSGVNETTVRTYVNVTNTEPQINSVLLDDSTASPANEIDLIAGSTQTVNCTVYYWDYNGWNDSNNITVNATLFASTSYSGDTNDNNYHYTNSSCRIFQTEGGDSGNGTGECLFNVQYFANDTTWTCNVTVKDLNFTDYGDDSTTVNSLVAISTPASINYGNLIVTEVSSSKPLNVTNFGNVNINYSVKGYGGDNETLLGANNSAMICPYGNISVGYERYGFESDLAVTSMINLTGNFSEVNVTIFERTNDNNIVLGQDVNQSWWKIEIPFSVGGYCNGSIVFRAEERE